MRRLLLYAGVAAASAAVQLTDIYGGELHMRHFQSRMVKDARETGVIVLTLLTRGTGTHIRGTGTANPAAARPRAAHGCSYGGCDHPWCC